MFPERLHVLEPKRLCPASEPNSLPGIRGSLPALTVQNLNISRQETN